MKKNRSTAQPGAGINRRKPQLMALEPRIMFDGAAIATTAEAAVLHVDALGQSTDATLPAPLDAAPAGVDGSEARAAAVATPFTQAGEIVFVDTSITGWQALVDEVRDGVEVVLLDPAREAFAQIAQRLQDVRGLDAIHVLSHGSDGALIIGGQTYDASNLADQETDLAIIGRSLAAEGDILLYGCDIGRGDDGAAFVREVARLTQADAAASVDTTGSAETWGGNWTLEARVGAIESGLFASERALADFSGKLSAVDLTGNSGWTAIMYGSAQDPQGDSQAGAADTDIVADAAHGSLYTAFDDGGTASTADDYLVFRVRVDNPTAPTEFGGVMVIGMDANLDGRIDVFMTVDGRSSSQVVRLMDPGTGANISPSTTTTTPLPAGWLPNNGVYPMTAANYSVVAVSSSTDPHWNGDVDMGNDGKTDAFVSFRIPMADLATVLAIPSPVDRDGAYGPRGAGGITGFTKDTMVSYVSFTQTQSGPINGDLNGVGGSYDKNATFAALGTFTTPMSASNPVPAATALTITDNVSGIAGGNVTFTFQFSEGVAGFDASDITVSGGTAGIFTAIDADTYTLVVAPNANTENGAITVSVNSAAATGTTSGLGNSSASATQAYDTQAPTVSVDPIATSGLPTISGTTNLPTGSTITVAVDPDNTGSAASVSYQALVQSGGTWSVNTTLASPSSGSPPVGGFTTYALVTATATDAAGNGSTATAIDKPVVNVLTTNSLNPTISGTWGGTNGGTDTLEILVAGQLYTSSTSPAVSISGFSWQVTLSNNTAGNGTALSINTYNVEATVKRSGTPVSEANSNELIIVDGPFVDITGAAQKRTASANPTISGTSNVPLPAASQVVTLRIDQDNNLGTTGDVVTYAVLTNSTTGDWSVNTATDVPISGAILSGGLAATWDLRATITDSSNRSATDDQDLILSIPSLTLSAIETTYAANATAVASAEGILATVILDSTLNAKEDDSVRVSGVYSNGSTGDQILVTVSDGTNTRTGTYTLASDGGSNVAWTIDFTNLSGLDDRTLTVTASLAGVSATNSLVKQHDKTPPLVTMNSGSMQSNSAAVSGYAETSPTSVTIGGTSVTPTYTTNTWSAIGTVANNASAAVVVVDSDAAGNQTTFTGSVGNFGNANFPRTIITTINGTTLSSSNPPFPVINTWADTSVTISGTSDNFGTGASVPITLIVSDANPTTSDVTTTLSFTQGSGSTAWSFTGLNLGTLDPGTLTVKASASYTNLPNWSSYQIYDYAQANHRTAYTGTVAITDMASGVAGTQVIAGSPIAITVSDNDLNTSATAVNTTTTVITVLNQTTGETETTSVTLTETGVNTGVFTASLPTTNNVAADTSNNANLNMSSGQTVRVTYADALTATGGTASPFVTADVTNAPPTIAITTPIGDGNLSAAEDDTVTVSGTTTNANGSTVTVTISDGTTPKTATGTVSGGTWTVTFSTGNSNSIATLLDTTLTVGSSVTTSGGTAISNATVLHDTVAPTISVTPLLTTGSPTISGTSNLTPGSTLSFSIDANNDNNLADEVRFATTVNIGGAWTLNTSSATADPLYPMPASGLSSSARISVTGSDAAGNSTTAVALDKPTVTSLTTNDTTPTLSGSWTSFAGDSLYVVVGSVAYGATAGVGVTLDGTAYTTVAGLSYTTDPSQPTRNTWAVTAGTLAATTHDVKAYAVRGASETRDATSSELLIDTAPPAVAIASITGDSGTSGDFITNDQTLVFAGSAENSASVLVVLKDASNNTVFSTTVIASSVNGSWSVDRTGQPALDAGSYTLTVTAEDDAGNAATATQAIGIDLTPPVVAITTNSRSPDTTPLITGTSDLPPGSSISLVIDTDNVPGGTTYTYTTTVQADGTWSVNTGTAIPSGEGAPITYIFGNTLGLTATGTDSAGNAATASKSLQLAAAPSVTITEPIGGTGADGIANATEDDAITISGASTGVASGGSIAVSITDGTLTISDTVTVDGGGNWSLTGLNLSNFASGNITVGAQHTDNTGSSYADTAGFTHDKTAPVVTVTALSTADTTPALGGTIDDATATIQVTVNGQSLAATNNGNGTWTLADDALSALATGATYSVSAVATDAAGNAGLDATSNELVILGTDSTAPTVTSILRQTPTAQLTNANSVVFRVGFSEAVQNLDTADFAISGGGAGGGMVSNVAAVAGQTGVYDVTVSGLAGNTGTLDLLLAGSPSIQDLAANALTNTTVGTTESYELDHAVPTLSGIDDGDADDLVLVGTTLTYTVTFSEDIDSASVTAADFNNSGTATVTIGAIAETSPGVFAIDVTVHSSGTLILRIPAGASILDPAGNPLNTAAALLDNDTVTVSSDLTRPIIDLAPTNGATLGRAFSTDNSSALSLDDDASAATVIESSDALNSITLTVAGLLDGANEKLTFGTTTVSANGSSGSQAGITVGGVVVSLDYSGGIFTVTKTPYVALTTAEAQAIIRDIKYRDIAAAPTGGDRTFSFSTTDEAGNAVLSPAVATVTVIPDTTAPTITGPVSKSIVENTTAVDGFSASEAVSWTLGGADAAKFSISAGGVLSFVAAPDFESPSDLGDTVGNNSYVVDVIATDASSNATTQSVTVSVSDVDELMAPPSTPNLPPFITSNGAGESAAISIPENETAVTTVTGADTETPSPLLTYSIAGGADAGWFAINAGTGALNFVSAPDFENPGDAGGNNVYDVVVQVSDGVSADRQAIAVTVTNVNETAPPDPKPDPQPDPKPDPRPKPEPEPDTDQQPEPKPDPDPTPVPGIAPATPRLQPDPIAPSFKAPVSFGGHDFVLPISPFTVACTGLFAFELTGVDGAWLGTDAVLERSVHFLTGSLHNVLTQSAPDAFQIVVAEGGDASLRLFRGIPDQELSSSRTISVQVPVDAFVHTLQEATVQLSARMLDGTALPAWLVFDASTGKFSGMVPAGAPPELAIVVEARDRDGRTAEAVFRIKIAPGLIGGRASLSEQIRSAARSADALDALRHLHPARAGADKVPA